MSEEPNPWGKYFTTGAKQPPTTVWMLQAQSRPRPSVNCYFDGSFAVQLRRQRHVVNAATSFIVNVGPQLPWMQLFALSNVIKAFNIETEKQEINLYYCIIKNLVIGGLNVYKLFDY
jgi:hypothetical protein